MLIAMSTSFASAARGGGGVGDDELMVDLKFIQTNPTVDGNWDKGFYRARARARLKLSPLNKTLPEVQQTGTQILFYVCLSGNYFYSQSFPQMLNSIICVM